MTIIKYSLTNLLYANIRCQIVNPIPLQKTQKKNQTIKKQKTSHFGSAEEIALLKEIVATLRVHNATLHRVIGERNETKNLERKWYQERECANKTSVRVQEKLAYINMHLIDTRNYVGF